MESKEGSFQPPGGKFQMQPLFNPWLASWFCLPSCKSLRRQKVVNTAARCSCWWRAAGRKALNAEGKQHLICYLVSRAERIPWINLPSKRLPSSTGYCSAAALTHPSLGGAPSLPPSLLSLPPSLLAVPLPIKKLFSTISTRWDRCWLSRSSRLRHRQPSLALQDGEVWPRLHAVQMDPAPAPGHRRHLRYHRASGQGLAGVADLALRAPSLVMGELHQA